VPPHEGIADDLCNHPNTREAREGRDLVVYCTNPRCGQETLRSVNHYEED
jgi:hypothetical protein